MQGYQISALSNGGWIAICDKCNHSFSSHTIDIHKKINFIKFCRQASLLHKPICLAEKIKKISLKPEDTIIFETNYRISEYEFNQLKNQIKTCTCHNSSMA